MSEGPPQRPPPSDPAVVIAYGRTVHDSAQSLIDTLGSSTLGTELSGLGALVNAIGGALASQYGGNLTTYQTTVAGLAGRVR